MSQSALGQKQVTLLLVAAAVLLAAIVGVLVWQNTNAPEVPAVGSATEPAGGSMGGAAPPANMGSAQAPAVEFDLATAPAVAEGQTPAEYVTAYYEACAAKDYGAAYELLPVASQQYYGDAASFEATLESYGVTDYSVGDAVESGDSVSVVGGQEAQGMMVSYEWLFVQADDGTLRLKSRTMAQ